MREFNGGGLVISGSSSVLPIIILVCSSCGEMKMLSAVMLGIIDNEEKDVASDGGQ